MRKITLFILVLSLTALSFVSCGGSAKRKQAVADSVTTAGILPYDAVKPAKMEAHKVDVDFSKVTISENVKKVILNRYTTDYQFSDGMLGVRNDETGKWGFINDKGDLVIDYKWHYEDYFTPKFNCGASPVCLIDNFRVKTWYIIDKAGNSVQLSKGVSSVTNFVDGYAAVREGSMMSNVKSFYYINTAGEKIFPHLSFNVTDYELKAPRPFCEGLAAFYDYAMGKYGFMNNKGEVVIESVFEEVSDFSEGLAAVRFSSSQGVKWGYINKNAEFVIDPVFTFRPGNFSNGFATAQKSDGKYVYINKTGEIASKEFTKAFPFVGGYAFVHTVNGWLCVVDTSMEYALVEGTNYEKGYDSDFYLIDQRPSLNIGGMSLPFASTPELTYIDGFVIVRTSSSYLFTSSGDFIGNIGSIDSMYGGLGQFYGNLVHAKHTPIGYNQKSYDGFIDYNKGMEFVILFEASTF